MVKEARVSAATEGKELKIFFQDEARFGRIDSLRLCWAPAGIRPLLKKQIIREYTYTYGQFVHLTVLVVSLFCL